MTSTFIIAEAGVNHNGNKSMAIDLIDVAIDAGADAVKFQSFKATSLTTKTAKKADYQINKDHSQESQQNMLKKLEISEDFQFELKEYCDTKKIEFMSTAFDHESLRFLINNLSLDTLKIPSGEINNAPLLLEFGKSNRDIIMSTGMSTISEIERALGVLAFGLLKLSKPSKERFIEAFQSNNGQDILKEKVSILHCTTEYPTPISDINLRAMQTIKEKFNLKIGYSDHTENELAAIASIALGGTIIEKHFTLDKKLDGPDHAASANPDELKIYIEKIRDIEKVLGSSKKEPVGKEKQNKLVARKSIVATKTIEEDELFTEENISTKRPADGMDPMDYWLLLGKKSTRIYQPDDLIEESV